MSKPIVAVVGRPNVGKSTLFNKLCGQRLAIVEDTAGARRWPHNLLNRVDLPTLGRPTTATIGLLIGVPPFLQPSQAQLTPRQLPRKGELLSFLPKDA